MTDQEKVHLLVLLTRKLIADMDFVRIVGATDMLINREECLLASADSARTTLRILGALDDE